MVWLWEIVSKAEEVNPAEPVDTLGGKSMTCHKKSKLYRKRRRLMSKAHLTRKKNGSMFKNELLFCVFSIIHLCTQAAKNDDIKINPVLLVIEK